jgi:hypothetical protein
MITPQLDRFAAKPYQFLAGYIFTESLSVSAGGSSDSSLTAYGISLPFELGVPEPVNRSCKGGSAENNLAFH